MFLQPHLLKIIDTCKDLTIEELKTTNGCGSSYWLAWVFRIPKFIWPGAYRCCNRHDLRYQNKEDKQRSDDELYDCWYYSAFHGPEYLRGFRLKIADLGYWALNTKLSNHCYKEA